MPWRDGALTVLPVRLDPAMRRQVEAHRAYLQARQRYAGGHDRISLAEAARDLFARALGKRELRAARAELANKTKTEQLGWDFT
jgi:hypothetical protein